MNVQYDYYAYNLSITNSLNIGNIDGTRAAGIIASIYSNHEGYITITNSYSLVEVNLINCTLCTVEQLNTKEFYTEVLGWSEDVWDFSSLDVENGKCPTLKA